MTNQTIPTKNLEGRALDWAFARSEGWQQMPHTTDVSRHEDGWGRPFPGPPEYLEVPQWFRPDQVEAARGNRRAQGLSYLPRFGEELRHVMAVVERDGIETSPVYGEGPERTGWVAVVFSDERNPQLPVMVEGPAMLIAAMRCHVIRRLGETVEVPREFALPFGIDGAVN